MPRSRSPARRISIAAVAVQLQSDVETNHGELNKGKELRIKQTVIHLRSPLSIVTVSERSCIPLHSARDTASSLRGEWKEDCDEEG